jgi:hypothetical protein
MGEQRVATVVVDEHVQRAQGQLGRDDLAGVVGGQVDDARPGIAARAGHPGGPEPPVGQVVDGLPARAEVLERDQGRVGGRDRAQLGHDRGVAAVAARTERRGRGLAASRREGADEAHLAPGRGQGVGLGGGDQHERPLARRLPEVEAGGDQGGRIGRSDLDQQGVARAWLRGRPVRA